jgi:prevent-host-death family protein
MKLSESVKPISYFKAHASEMIRDVSEHQKTMVITLNGEAKAVVQNLAMYEQMKDTIALLKMLAQSTDSKHAGHFKPVDKAFSDLRARIRTNK